MQLQHAIADEWDCVAVGAGELEFFGVQGQVADVLLQGWELGMAQLTELDVVNALDHVNFQVVEEALGTTEKIVKFEAFINVRLSNNRDKNSVC